MYKLTKNDWTCLSGRQVSRPLFLLVSLALWASLGTQSHEVPARGQEPLVPPVVQTVAAAQTESPQTPVKISGLSLRIDAIGLNIPLGKTSLNKNRALMVPANANQAAWYKSGPKPGDNGTALVTGHYDANGGVPGVFYKLDQLAVGDIISVNREDGKTAVFRVDQLASYKQDHSFPWSLVYRTQGEPGLRIITCDGTYNPKTGRYSHNLVVYASLIKISS